MDYALKTLFDGFMLAKEAEGVRDRTLETYQTMFKSLVDFFPPERLEDAAALTRQDLQEWVIYLKDHGYADATRDQRISKAKTFFRWCQAEGFLEKDPSAPLKRPKKTWQPDPFSETELELLLHAAKHGSVGIRNYAMICFFLDSGIRNTELRLLVPEDVDIKTGQVKIREGKGGKPRTVFIGKLAKQALWKWLMVRPEGATRLFCSNRGRESKPTNITRIVRRIGERCGVHAYPHRFRHTFAPMYLKVGGTVHAPIPAGP